MADGDINGIAVAVSATPGVGGCTVVCQGYLQGMGTISSGEQLAPE